jgi:hypothetical protein
VGLSIALSVGLPLSLEGYFHTEIVSRYSGFSLLSNLCSQHRGSICADLFRPRYEFVQAYRAHQTEEAGLLVQFQCMAFSSLKRLKAKSTIEADKSGAIFRPS